MKSILLVILFISFFDPIPLQGRWQLTRFDAFSETIVSKFFLGETEERQKLMLETFDFVLANTFYEFKGDSVFFTNAGGGGIIQYKSGKWISKGDTLFIFESGKFKTHKFWIENQTAEELELKNFIPTVSGIQKGSSMIFTKIP
ncbi:MAG: hypothetical protein ACI9UV_002969 [Algoriphagus sp.]|jgi:hypothetical protein